MYKIIAGFFALSIALGGCATTPQAPLAPAPTCSTEADCTAKWAAARTFVLSHAGYKIETYSADFLQTFNPGEGDTQLAATVNKAPLPGGGYAIQATFFCGNVFGCTPSARDTLDQFNKAVAAAGVQQ
jgi:hypothetical protein